jgi:Co/Zn/Cd efflux system component
MANTGGWVGVDLDGTLAYYTSWQGVDHIGVPVPAMLRRVKAWRQAGTDVKIVTARVSALYLTQVTDAAKKDALQAKSHIQDWCLTHIGEVLPVTAVKDYAMIELWDDRCVQVIPNTGQRADNSEGMD